MCVYIERERGGVIFPCIQSDQTKESLFALSSKLLPASTVPKKYYLGFPPRLLPPLVLTLAISLAFCTFLLCDVPFSHSETYSSPSKCPSPCIYFISPQRNTLSHVVHLLLRPCHVACVLNGAPIVSAIWLHEGA